MYRETRILTYLLILLTLLAESQQNCINRFNTKTNDANRNLNNFELISKIRAEINAEKRRFRRDCNPESFLGSNLFDGIRKKCFSAEDISLMTARKDFEAMIPPKMPPILLTNKQVNWIIRYFCYGHFLIDKMKDTSGSRIVKRAFYDTLGGFLHYYLLPIAKASFYAGRVKVETVLKVIAHYHKCRRLLNTNGNGWRPPMADPLKQLRKGTVKQLKLKCHGLDWLPGEQKFCAQLNLQSVAASDDVVDDSMIVGLPRIEIEDSDGFLGNIYLPYVRKRTFNLRSPKSADVLVGFYKTVNACYKEKNMDPMVFNSKLRDWIMENIQPHLNDEVFYPGFGRVLNLYETLRHGAEKPKLKKKCKKPMNKCGERKKRCREDVNEALLKHRRKTLKYINLESKAKQIDFDDCESNWLESPLITGKAVPKTKGCGQKKAAKKKFKWFGKSGEGSKKIDKGKDEDSKKKKDKDSGSSKKKWSLGRWYKKGSWGLIFPKLKGLSFFGKIWEIFKFIFIVILVIFLLWLLFKIAVIAVTLCAGAMPCIQIIMNILYEFGKLLLKVLAKLCSCLAALPCWRTKGGKEGNTSKGRDPVEVKVVVNTENGKQQNSKNSRYKNERASRSVEPPPPPPPTVADSKKKSKESKKDKKSKSMEKSNRKSKELGRPTNEPPPPPPPGGESSKKAKKDKSQKEKNSKNLEPTPVLSDQAEPAPKESAKNSKEKSKKDKKSKSAVPPEATGESESQPPEELTKKSKDKAKKDKKAKEKSSKKTKKSKYDEEPLAAGKEVVEEDKSKSNKKPKKIENPQQTSFDENIETVSKPTRTKRSRFRERKGRERKRRRGGGSDDESDSSSKRLVGGHSYPYRNADSSSQEDHDGKNSWKTFYDF